jgi:hypothetical protein
VHIITLATRFFRLLLEALKKAEDDEKKSKRSKTKGMLLNFDIYISLHFYLLASFIIFFSPLNIRPFLTSYHCLHTLPKHLSLFQVYRERIKAYKSQIQKLQSRINELEDDISTLLSILKSLKHDHNPNYHDMAVKTAISGFDEFVNKRNEDRDNVCAEDDNDCNSDEVYYEDNTSDDDSGGKESIQDDLEEEEEEEEDDDKVVEDNRKEEKSGIGNRKKTYEFLHKQNS